MLPDHYGSDYDYDAAMGRPDESLDEVCDNCGRRPPVTKREDGEIWCQVCVDNDVEAAGVFDYESGHGSSVPITNAERLAMRRR